MQLTAIDLGHSFAGLPALFTGQNFTIAAGEMVALVGPSGSGKSTLLHIMAGWLPPSSGQVERTDVQTVTWVPQNPFGVARRSVADHVALALLCRGVSRRRADSVARRVLAEFGLAQVADSPFAALSGGEGQRLMLARASLTAADLLLVDEPTAQLDPTSALAVIASLGSIASAGRLVAIATHDPRVAAACDRVIDLGVHR